MALNTFCLSLLQYFAKVLNCLCGSHLWQSYTVSRVTTSHYLLHSSFTPRHFFLFFVTTFPFLKVASDSWVCVKEDIFTTLPSTFPSPHYPSPWERDGVRILFLSPRNPVFTIFGIAVLCYHSTTYIPFLYQSSKIRISFL